MCQQVSYKKKYMKKIFIGILKVTEERSRIRSWCWIRIHWSEAESVNTELGTFA
jgi:hypothetical protein